MPPTSKLTLTLHSDIHSEFYRHGDYDFFFHDLDPTGVDVAVLAGDILLGRNSHDFLRQYCQLFPAVVYVAGNHEYYTGEFKSVQKHLHNTGIENLHFLEKESVEIKGRRFTGATLWYNGGPNCVLGEYYMNDFRRIHNVDIPFRQFIYKYAKDSRAWLKDNIQEGDVVVSHMLPSQQCIDNSYRGDMMNDFYFHDCDQIIEDNKPALWVHGHSHNHYDKMHGATRVLRNPHGYPREHGVGHQKNLRIVI